MFIAAIGILSCGLIAIGVAIGMEIKQHARRWEIVMKVAAAMIAVGGALLACSFAIH